LEKKIDVKDRETQKWLPHSADNQSDPEIGMNMA